MFFPYGDDQVHGGHRPLISHTFLALNIGVFIWQLIEPGGGAFTMRYSAIPADILALRHWDTLVTSMFLHGGFLHLLGNMLFLWIFADNIESTIGSLRFLVFYLLGGIAATAAHIITDPFSPVPMLGASGAISAVLGCFRAFLRLLDAQQHWVSKVEGEVSMYKEHEACWPDTFFLALRQKVWILMSNQ
jgi:membrane associated rhomboid family serine protease